MKKKIIILTGSELRHKFFRIRVALNKNINVLQSFCESTEGNLNSVVKSSKKNNLRLLHLEQRFNSEKLFFNKFCNEQVDYSNPVFIEKGDINLPKFYNEIIGLNPDLIISYGCSIIKSELLDIFKGRFINIHLGLSPYYRGSGTNYWPLVNNEPQFVGTTFMHIDSGVDTGKIIHQIRPEINLDDDVHSIGNKLIVKSTVEIIKLILAFDKLEDKLPLEFDKKKEMYYRKKDFSEESVKKLNFNFSNNMILDFIKNKDSLFNTYPILVNNI